MNDQDDESLERLQKGQELAAEDATATDECPPAEQLFDLRHAALSPEVAAQVTEHVAGCSACAEALRLAVEMAPLEQPSVRSTSAGRGWLVGGVVLLAAGLATLLLGRPRLSAPTTSPDETPDVFRGVDGLSFARSGPRTAPRDAFELSWSAGPAGTLYDVRVHDAELKLLHEAFAFDEPRIVVPAAALSDHPDGARVLWIVTAHLPDGRRVTLPTWTTHVTRPQGN